MVKSHYQFLTDEERIGTDIGEKVDHPIRVFTLEGIGVDQAKLIADINPTFGALQPDIYALKREHVDYLLDRFPAHREFLMDFFFHYHAGQEDLSHVLHLIRKLPAEEQREKFWANRPNRYRAVANFHITYVGRSWEIERFMQPAYKQDVVEGDVRSLPRHFEEADTQVTDHPEFRKLLKNLATLVRENWTSANRLAINMHQVALVAYDGDPGDNSPEGIHQDGADYIVSALVFDRQGIAGAESTVYGAERDDGGFVKYGPRGTTKPDTRRVYLKHTLQPGEGLFQADSSSPLWHHVSKIQLLDGAKQGYRNIIGFDIKVE